MVDKKHTATEQEAWLHTTLNELDIEKLTDEQKTLKTVFNTLIGLVDDKLKYHSEKILALSQLDDKTITPNQREDRIFHRKCRQRLIETFDTIEAVMYGKKHPIQRYINAARTRYGGKSISYREIRFRAICVGFILAYVCCKKVSERQSIFVLVQAIKGDISRPITAATVKSYLAKHNGLHGMGDHLISEYKDIFSNLLSQSEDNAIIELRFAIVQTESAENVEPLYLKITGK